MKLIHIVPHINEEAAGPSYSVPHLCQSLALMGNEVELSCLAAKSDIPGVSVVIHREWPIIKKFAISTSLAKSLRFKSKRVDIIHNHSLWSMVNIATGWVISNKGAKLVTSPRGTLSNWALKQNRLMKKLMWPLQRRLLAKSDMIHATSLAEYNDIRSKGFDSPIAIIPNGIDIPLMPLIKVDNDRRVLLFLGRLHPTKCVDRLLHAWKQLQTTQMEWDLVIVGKGDIKYEKYLKSLKESLNLNRVNFSGALYGDDKSRAYNNADLFILPSHSENFGVAVSEALSHGCPTVVSTGAPWSELEEKGCGWWTENDVSSLVKTLNIAMSQSKDRLTEMGNKGCDWMKQDYGWELIANKMNESYTWLIEGGKCPEWIKLR